MQHTIKKDYFWNTLGVLLQNAISPLLLIVVTRVNGINDSGLFSFAFSISIISWSLAMWGGRTYQVSDTTKEYSTQGYVAVRIVLGALVMISAAVFVVADGYSPEKAILIIILTLLKVLESVADVIYGILQVRGRLYVSGVSLTIKTLVSVAVFIIALIFTHNLLISSALLVVINALVIMLFDIRKAMQVVGRLESHIKVDLHKAFTEVFAIMKRTWPILAMSLLAALSINIPRYFLDRYHESQIGYFGILAMPIALLTLLITFILQPNVVHLSQLYTRGVLKDFQKIITKIATYTLMVGLIILIATYVIGVTVLNIVFGIDFTQYKGALMVVVVGALANTMVGIMTNSLTIMRHFKQQF